MPAKKLLFYTLNAIGLGVLTAVGILLFFMRNEKMPQPIAHEIKIEAEASVQTIISHQFLILINDRDAPNILDILQPLNLRLKAPILNWLLVESKNEEPRYVALKSSEADASRSILNALLQHPKIIDAQHNFLMKSALLPTNKNFLQEWHLQTRSDANPASLQLPFAWDISQGSRKVSVAIVDDFLYQDIFTFNLRFAECSKRVQFKEPFASLKIDKHGSTMPHGELMLHALGACANIYPFSTGIDWQAQLIAVQRPTEGHAQSFLAALYASNIDVCRQSIVKCPPGFSAGTSGVKADVLLLPFASDAPELLQFTADMLTAINRQNTIVVSAAGNNQTAASNFFPGGAPGIINVGSLNHRGERSKFSNFGPSIDIFAPGEKIDLFYPNGKKNVSGTSMAAAFTAGAISLMKSVDPKLSYISALHHLKKSARIINCEDYCKKDIIKNTDQKCAELCCSEKYETCGRLALNINEALRSVKNRSDTDPMIEVSNYYIVFLRDIAGQKTVIINNVGGTETNVKVITYDDNISVDQPEFILGKKGSINASTQVNFSLKKEPFTRQTSKIEFVAENKGKIFDSVEIYWEYVPKK